MPEQFDKQVFNDIGLNSYIHSANKKGYSGVAILSKKKPNNIKYGCGIEIIDFEGRIIRADYDGFSVMSVYFPSGSSGDIRQEFKFKFLKLNKNRRLQVRGHYLYDLNMEYSRNFALNTAFLFFLFFVLAI